ncbi:sporulation peptidase family protein [Clostridium pasteurianum DSM 525 = ATCC 6013]|uniref:Sporulation peptidase YabG n=1 Tax=Clostridium pasteurianum DSM 525 = ATCC 6013 TaxID=1262449 RepID=A0A0H3J5Z3_CLOPA|nr:sporulation peptidase YabG [Clostridium pasteurianum]AJA46345.1 sporulation peptidase family protein [Clostridium pasteurianum DSM 525 = ATCC 6013]AJA50333.1 sporulation peptidase family protein [Clostridium pasteurianum DSM 525 = ATCC 6013]AOZ73785.1 peptidase [Clostridium pasteurianum DSM 525 = ATCC 6013]AOZ77582.1 peptidase [Clostridium pasteurianum]ELP60922.1 sporulation peptidase YabG [Clostridium pasteurianum DSM 525 = ATCC 6013]
MKIGDIVVRKSYDKDVTFKIIDIKDTDKGTMYVLNGVNLRIVADSPLEDLEQVDEDNIGLSDVVFNKKVNESIKNIIESRRNNRKTGKYKNHKKKKREKSYRESKDTSSSRQTALAEIYPRDLKKIKITQVENSDSMIFSRPGKILHVDGDPNYLDVCIKVYKQLSINAIGKVISESEQPSKIVDIVKEVKPDIVVITGHDGVAKGVKDYFDLNNYRNSKYFVDSVARLRDYEPNYDDLVIYAGACQSFYEAILDAGANYASSPERVLIHCLDPVFVCQKVAYTNINDIVNIREVVSNTITGAKGVGGLQTRGKCREGYPRSAFFK